MLGAAEYRAGLAECYQASVLFERAPRSRMQPAFLRPLLLRKPLPAGKAVGLEEEAEDERAVRRHRLMFVSGRPPHELAGSADALVILERALEHERLLER